MVELVLMELMHTAVLVLLDTLDSVVKQVDYYLSDRISLLLYK